MLRISVGIAAATVLLFAACNDATTASNDSLEIASAFNSVPAGFDNVQSSFADATAPDGVGAAGMPWMPRGDGRGRGPGGPGMGGFMGGGLGLDFIGGLNVGHGFGHGPFGGDTPRAACTFSSATGDVTCTETHDGVTITRVATYKTADGVAQAKPDSLTNSARVQVSVSGTRTRRDSATAVLASASDRMVTGLVNTSTSRTVNGASSGTETTTGTNDKGAFTAVRVAGDTVTGVIVPVTDGRPTYPTAGTVVRSMKVTATVDGATPTVSTRREVVTYDGSATAKAVITENGTSKTCSVPLPRGRPTCQ